MAKQIIKKKYYRIRFMLTSPLGIGSGNSSLTDRDIIRNSFGDPYIPATAIAGITRELLQKEAKANDYYGIIGEKDIESRLIFYDAEILKQEKLSAGQSPYTVSVRDCVSLDDYKTAIPGSKFDMEILEPNVRFETYIEQSYYQKDDLDFAEKIAQLFLSGAVIFGGKSSRGYGRIGKVTAESVEFVLEKKTDNKSKKGLDEWLTFDIYDASCWEKWGENIVLTDNKSPRYSLEIRLCQKSGISIRRYTTKVRDDDTSPEPDHEQITLRNGVPVIPGTSWAGAFRHHMRLLGLKKPDEERLFGYVCGVDKKSQSNIFFMESMIEDAKEKILSRTALDRFDGGVVQGALLTEKTWYGGNTVLQIDFKHGFILPDDQMSILAAALADLHYGILSVGGETAIGRGLFSVKEINGKAITDGDDVFDQIIKQIKEVFAG